MSHNRITLMQSDAAAESGWKGSITVDPIADDCDGDLAIRADDLLANTNTGGPTIYLDAAAQRELRDFLNDQLGDAGGDETVDALDGLTDAIHGLTDAVFGLEAPTAANNFASEKPLSVVDIVTDLFNPDRKA